MNEETREFSTQTREFSLSDVTVVHETGQVNKVNIMLSRGWKLLGVGGGEDGEPVYYSLGWTGDPAAAPETIPRELAASMAGREEPEPLTV